MEADLSQGLSPGSCFVWGTCGLDTLPVTPYYRNC